MKLQGLCKKIQTWKDFKVAETLAERVNGKVPVLKDLRETVKALAGFKQRGN